ncbi:MAG: hypothetical protein WC612_01475 [Bdellovibrionales bacterium]|jgi:hypothetical protein
MFSILIKDTPARAKIVRRGPAPFLLAAFQMSSPPLVWQVDLEKMSNTTVSLHEKEGSWELGYTQLGQGDLLVVATFDERHEAEKAYGVVLRALGRSSGPLTGGSRFLRFLVWVILLGALLFVGLSFFTVKSASSPEVTSVAQPQQTQEVGARPEGSPAEIHTGVPAIADDVLPRVP